MREKIAKVPGLLNVTTDLYIKNPQMTVDIDREKAAVYGVTVDQVRNQLYDAFGARQIGTIYMPSNDYQIILEAQPQFRVDPSNLSKLYMKTDKGQTIPLDAVAKLVPSVGPLQINHQGQQPAVTISFNLQPGYSLGYAVDQITALEQAANLPATIATGFSGTAQVFQESLRGQGVLILAAVFAAFVILGILYESFIHPITIISGLPSAGIGAILTLMLFNMELSVIAMIGIVMLVGIVKKNAIMMVDFALGRRRVGLSAEHAIREAALLRFRPIMMTTFAAIFGTLPIAIGAGAGAELRQPLGVAVAHDRVRREVQHPQFSRRQLDHAPCGGVEAGQLDDVRAGKRAAHRARLDGRVRQACEPARMLFQAAILRRHADRGREPPVVRGVHRIGDHRHARARFDPRRRPVQRQGE